MLDPAGTGFIHRIMGWEQECDCAPLLRVCAAQQSASRNAPIPGGSVGCQSVLNAPEHDVLLQLLSGATSVSHRDVPESPAGDFPFLLYPASPKLLSCNFQVPAILFLEDGDIFCFSGPRTVPGVWAASFEPTQHCGSGPSRHQSSTAGSSGAQSITHSSG